MAEEVGNHNQPDDSKTTPNAFRVKLYKLDTEGGWEDQGTGFCIYTAVSGRNLPSFILMLVDRTRVSLPIPTHGH